MVMVPLIFKDCLFIDLWHVSPNNIEIGLDPIFHYLERRSRIDHTHIRRHIDILTIFYL